MIILLTHPSTNSSHFLSSDETDDMNSPPPQERQLFRRQRDKAREKEATTSTASFYEGGIARFLHDVETESLANVIDVMFLHGKSRVDVLLNLTGKRVSFSLSY